QKLCQRAAGLRGRNIGNSSGSVHVEDASKHGDCTDQRNFRRRQKSVTPVKSRCQGTVSLWASTKANQDRESIIKLLQEAADAESVDPGRREFNGQCQ